MTECIPFDAICRLMRMRCDIFNFESCVDSIGFAKLFEKMKVFASNRFESGKRDC